MAKVLLEEEQVSYKASKADISNLKFQRYVQKKTAMHFTLAENKTGLSSKRYLL